MRWSIGERWPQYNRPSECCFRVEPASTSSIHSPRSRVSAHPSPPPPTLNAEQWPRSSFTWLIRPCRTTIMPCWMIVGGNRIKSTVPEVDCYFYGFAELLTTDEDWLAERTRWRRNRIPISDVLQLLALRAWVALHAHSCPLNYIISQYLITGSIVRRKSSFWSCPVHALPGQAPSSVHCCKLSVQHHQSIGTF